MVTTLVIPKATLNRFSVHLIVNSFFLSVVKLML